MIRSVLIYSASGIVLFEKEWLPIMEKKSAQMVGGLLASVQELSRQCVGMTVSYIECTSVGVTMVFDEKHKLNCTLFHATSTGSQFGQLIAAQILRSFVADYAAHGDLSRVDTGRFHGFVSKLPDIIACCPRTILEQLQAQKGALSTLLADADRPVHATGNLVDPLSVVANLQELLSAATELRMNHFIPQLVTPETVVGQDTPHAMCVEMSRQVVFVHRLQGSSALLVAMCRPTTDRTAFAQHVSDAVTKLEKVFELQRNLHGNR